MNIKAKSWIIYTVLAAVSALVWWKLSYPQLAFTNFTIDRRQAREIASAYLQKEQDVDLSQYRSAVVFHDDERPNRFLQRTLGLKGFKEFIEEHEFDVFYWIVRFFREGEKEQHRVFVSSATGEVIAYRRSLEDTYRIETITRPEARQKGEAFLENRFGIDLDEYTNKSDLKHLFDFRADYSFSWQKKSGLVKWDDDPDAGYGKLITSVKISGDKVLHFVKIGFKVPDRFNRQVAQLKNTGHNLSTIIRVIHFLLFFLSIYFILKKRDHLAMHMTKRFYIAIILISFGLSIVTSLNQFESIMFDYNTTAPLGDFLVRLCFDTVFHGLLISILLLTPGLSGELIHFEQYPDHKEGAFLYYIRSSFFTRQAAALVILGYLVCIILLGIQSVLIEIGQRYWGVWREYTWMIKLTSAYVPFLAGLTLAYKASFMEELMYRMFAISLGKKFFKNTAVAVVVSSVVWGFGHSGYTIFPMWFRGVEVTCLGIFLGFTYIRYGIIPVITAHFLFDTFWNTAGYLGSNTNPVYFFSTLFLLSIPLIYAGLAFYLNRQNTQRPLAWILNQHQKYNLIILKNYLKSNWDHFGRQEKESIKKEIASHNWDLAVVDMAVEEVSREKGKARKL